MNKNHLTSQDIESPSGPCPPPVAPPVRHCVGRRPGFVEALAVNVSPACRARLLALVLSESRVRTGEGCGALDVAAVTTGARDAAFRAGLLPHIQDTAHPAAAHGGHYLVPIEATSIHRRLAALLVAETHNRAVASRLLATMEARRFRFGQPADEKLHPDIARLPALGMPWPVLRDYDSLEVPGPHLKRPP